MAITASTNSTQREITPAGNYLARCYQMVEIGTVKEMIMGTEKILHRVRIGWELPTEKRVFNEDKGEQPFVVSKEYTLSLHEKSTLRNDLKSWRGKDFTEEEAKGFDITKLVGVACMINIIHKPGKADPSKMYAQISSITPIPKGLKAPDPINPKFVLSYDSFDQELFDSLPDFIKDKMKTSMEYAALKNPHEIHTKDEIPVSVEEESDLPF